MVFFFLRIIFFSLIFLTFKGANFKTRSHELETLPILMWICSIQYTLFVNLSFCHTIIQKSYPHVIFPFFLYPYLMEVFFFSFPKTITITFKKIGKFKKKLRECTETQRKMQEKLRSILLVVQEMPSRQRQLLECWLIHINYLLRYFNAQPSNRRNYLFVSKNRRYWNLY